MASVAFARELPVGESVYEMQEPTGATTAPLAVYCYRAANWAPGRPIVFVFHGMNRNADDYRASWERFADEDGLLIVCPEFTDAKYPGSRYYNIGNLMDKTNGKGNLQPKDEWVFPVVDRVIRDVKERMGAASSPVAVFGHSAGAQMVHRYALFGGPTEANLIMPANAGWYTMPDENVTVGANYTVEWPGNGSKETPYLIYTTEQLDLLSTRVNGENSATYNTKYYKLMASIAYDDAVANNFTAIGTTIQNQFDHNFNGHFDGQGHTISGINSVSQWVYYNGLFGALESDAEVKDVTLANSTIGDGERAGGIAGWNKGTITGCRVISDVIINGDSPISYVHGGIVGANEGTVSRCTFTGSLTRTFSNPDPESIMYVYSYGGIVGINNENATLSDNFVASAVIPTTMHGYGAIAGLQRGTLTHNYYAACTVASTADATDVGCSSVSGTTITHGDVTENDGAVPGNVRTIAAPTDWNSQSPDGWAFIASPLYDDVNPQASDTVEMIFNGTDYDLYRLNPGTARWENWKTDENNNNAAPGFYLENGRSYLYATQTEKTVKFKGNADAFNLSDTTEVELGQGFNLVGNPFPRAAWIDKPYYTLNSNGSIVLTDPESTSTPISPCYGVVVEAQSDDETVTFSTTAPSTSGAVPNNGSIQMTLAQAVSTRGSASMKTLQHLPAARRRGIRHRLQRQARRDAPQLQGQREWHLHPYHQP